MSWKTTSGNSDAGEVLRIFQMLTPKPDDLVKQGRKFVKEGDCQVWSVKERMKKNRHLFLFNDVLLITKKEGKKKFWLKVYISLRSGLKIQDVNDSTNDRPDVEFRIYAPKKTFILFGFNPAHKYEWINAIQAQIDGIEGRVENAKKEHIESLYQAPPPQPSIDFDSPEPARLSMAPGAFTTPAPSANPAYRQTAVLSALPEPAYEEPAVVPVLPPPPGMKRESVAPGAVDPFAAPAAADPFLNMQVTNPYAPQGYAQPNPYAPAPAQPNPYAPAPAHVSVYGAPGQVINPYAPPQMQPVAYAPAPAHVSIYGAPGGFQPAPFAPAPGGMPALPPKPAQYTPPASQQQQPDPFASLVPSLPPKPLPKGPPAQQTQAKDPFGDDEFEALARRSQAPGQPF